MSFKFGDKVYLTNPAEHEQYYRGLIGVITKEANEDGEIMVLFKGDYKAKPRGAEELKLVKAGN